MGRNVAALRVFLLAVCLLMMAWGSVGENAQAQTPPTTPGAANAVKWHPGHYVALMREGMKDPATGRGNAHYLHEVKQELDATPALRGVLIRYTWAELEPVEGRYDFSLIEQHLSELAAANKRLVIMLQTRIFGYPSDGPIAPAYIMDPKNANTYEGGAFAFSTLSDREGYNLKLWNPEVYKRYVALIAELGARFNSHPNLEAVVREETALAQDHALDAVIDESHVAKYYDNLLLINQEMRRDFPNTVTIQFTNYPRKILASFTEKLKAMGAGVGSPDIIPDEPGLNYFPHNPGIYTYYPGLATSVPLAPMVSRPSYEWTRLRHKQGKNGDGGHHPTLEEIYRFAADRLKANYLFWTRVREKEQPAEYYTGVLTMLNQPAWRTDPAGGLDKTCPTAFLSCRN